MSEHDSAKMTEPTKCPKCGSSDKAKLGTPLFDPWHDPPATGAAPVSALPERCGGGGWVSPKGPHKTVWEYDGAFYCQDCKARWGAISNAPKEYPAACGAPVSAEWEREREAFERHKHPSKLSQDVNGWYYLGSTRDAFDDFCEGYAAGRASLLELLMEARLLLTMTQDQQFLNGLPIMEWLERTRKEVGE
jgi:hypothetical protein